jgi:hypothetical protein
MPETTAPAVTPPAPPAAGTPSPAVPRETWLQKTEDWFRHGEGDAAKVATALQSALQDRSGEILDVAGDFIAMAKLVDPAAGPLADSVQALLPKVLAMAENAARDTRAALSATPS